MGVVFKKRLIYGGNLMLNKKMWISEVVWPSKGNEGA